MIRIIVLGFLVGFFIASIVLANARDDGQWTRNPDPRIHEWFQSLMQPGTRSSCCAEADAFEADQVQGDNPDGSINVVITNGRGVYPDGTVVNVPKERIQYSLGNPTGHVILFMSVAWKTPLCYVPLPLF